MSVDPALENDLIELLPSLRAFAMSLVRNSSAADDLVQDTVVKAWSNLDKFQAGTNMRAWLFTILRNTYYSDRRKRSREVEDAEGTLTASLTEKPAHDGRLAMNDFKVAFEQLPDEQREALILVGASGFSYEEAAETCGCAVGTIKSRVNRGRVKLAELMQLDGRDPLEMTDASTLAVLSASRTAAG